MATDINLCMMRFKDRAERIEPSQIIETFVDVGPLLNILESENNQLVYGRRGVGKTHALLYLGDKRTSAGDFVVYVDCRNLGSNISIYTDPTLSRPERATRLLIDVCSQIHESILDRVTDPAKDYDYSKVVPVLNDLLDGIGQIRILGDVQKSESSAEKAATGSKSGLVVAAKPSASFEGTETTARESSFSRKQTGRVTEWIDFGNLGRVFSDLSKSLDGKRIWLLIDEWSAIPHDLQPHLADLLRRTVIVNAGLTVKIGAIEHRSNFMERSSTSDYIGLEIGSDITPAIDLDDYLVFDRNSEKATEFFRGLIGKHIKAVSEELDVKLPEDSAAIIALAFTQENVFREFVIATEGVPRDALHILQRAATKADNSLISLPVLKDAVLGYYQTDKYNSINGNEPLRLLLEWIRDEVIGGRRTRAFLLPVGTNDPLIDELFDRRALHILNRSMSAAHRPGERFVVYKLDYGCYVDLRATDKFPSGLLFANEEETDSLPEVPEDDARSYRRAVLELSDFYTSHPSE